MQNISINGQPVILHKNETYYVIDASYIMDIKKEMDALNWLNIDKELREKVFAFPCTDTPFAKFHSTSATFSIDRIKKANYERRTAENDVYFACDTGLIIMIKENQLPGFSKQFDYDKLVESNNELLNIAYWQKLTLTYNPGDVAVILSPGVGTGFDFAGSGTYQILI